MRIISGAEYLAHTAPLFYSLNILDIYGIYSMHMFILAFQINSCNSSYNSLSINLQSVSSIHNYNTRSSVHHNVYVNRFNKISNKCFTTRLANAWNKLPDEIKTLSSHKIYVVKKWAKAALLSRFV